tara:strand:- start:10905 stop:11744 length:840 start_codon:yes stop_codon:yes gene_type:complete
MKLSSLYEELSSRKVQAIIKRKPDFFQNRVRFVLGAENGVFDFEINISPEDIGDYVNGDYNIRTYTTKDDKRVETGLFETIIDGDTFDIYEHHSYDGDWESVLDYYLSPENEETIRGYINQLIKREGKEIEDHEGESLQDLLEQYDTEDHIKNVLRDSLSNAQADDYVNYLKEQLRDCLMEYGDIKSFDHEGATLKIKFSTLLDMLGLDVDDVDVIDKMDEDCGYDPKCYFEEMFYKNTYDSPSFKPDERYSGDASNEDVNSMIVDRLGEVGYDYKIEG